MRKPQKIPIEKYDYPLPDDRIAKYPLIDRDASKILVYRPGGGTGPGAIEHKQFSQVPELLEKGDRLYFNATRVVQARLVFRKETGARIEIFCLEPHVPADHQLAFSSTQPVEFICLVGNAKKWKEGKLTKMLESKEACGKSGGEVNRDMGIPGGVPDKTYGEQGNLQNGIEITNREQDKVEKDTDRNTGETRTFKRATGETTGENKIKREESGGCIGEMKNPEKSAEQAIDKLIVTADITGRQDDKFIVRFEWNDPITSFGEILERSGSTPIPPYLNREADERDATTYQTVYARQDGSVAAPTAGLHFTEDVLKKLDQKGVQRHELILHVGAGTFIPVKEKNAVNHQMHAELVTADRSLLESLLSGDRKIAVGTTTTRSLESLYWLGVRAISSEKFSFDNLLLDQWDAYEMEQGDKPEKPEHSLANEMEDPVPLEKGAAPHKLEHSLANEIEDSIPLDKADRTSMANMKDPVPLEKAIRTLIKKMDEAGIDSFSFHTRLMITPGYRFRVISGLFTNFHQPKSTLLLLIAAVAGNDWRKIYDYALENEFRFLSYGDSSLLFFQ
jgi:S-adenosylmethionine:tRNA-ribosyltransferase-isomerase (queuine synthetase)